MLKKRIPILFLMILPLLAALALISGLYSPTAKAAPTVPTAPTYTWTAQTSGTTEYLMGSVYGGGQFVVVGDNGTILTSPDGTTWITQTSGVTPALYDVAYDGSSLYVVTGYGGHIVTSPNGITWTQQTPASSAQLFGVTYGNGLFVATGNGSIQTSPDGVNWTHIDPGVNAMRDVVYGNNQFVAVGADTVGSDPTVALTSPDGVNWTIRDAVGGASDNPRGVAYGGGQFVAVAYTGLIQTSPNGITWTERISSTAQPLLSVAYGDSQFIATGGNGTILTSPDGITWTSETSGSSDYLEGAAYDGSKFVVVGGTGTILTSGAAAALPTGIPVSDITTGNTTANSNTSRNVAVGLDGTIYVAYHGTNGVRVARSTDDGASYLPSVQLDAGDYEVEITVDLNHDVYAAWSDGTVISVSRSIDNGATFSPAVNAGTATDSQIHVDTDAPYVYVVDADGQNLHVSVDNGQTFTTYSTGLPTMVFSDVRVNKRNGDVFVLADNPQLYMARSTDNGQTFGAPIQPTGTIFYSSYAASFSDTDWYGFVSGGNNSSNAYRINLQTSTSTPLTFGTNVPNQSRSLAIDNCAQVVDGYSDSSSLFFAASTDLGNSFGIPTTVSTGSDLSVAVDSVTGNVLTVYEDGGQIYASVYDAGLAACDAAGGRPVADSQVVTTTINTALPITLTATDPDMDTLTYTVATTPTHGTLSGTAPNLTYTPDTGYVGTDSFTFYANDGTANSNTATIDINVTASTVTPPTVTTDAATAISSSGSTLNGTVNANGDSTAVTFEYGLTTAYGTVVTADQSPVTGSTATAVSNAITGLTANTTYHYRAVGVNAGGTVNGADMTFTTSAAATPPTVTTDAATAVSETGATLNGAVNANGDSTTVTFEYGLTTAYGTVVTADQSPVTGSTATAVSKTITGLTANTTYHYRAVGVNGGGTVTGADMTFTTSAAPAATADLAISQSLSIDFLNTIFTIVAQNDGPDAAPGAVVSATFPVEITNVTWTCVGSGGANCAASGSGNTIYDTLGSFPNGGVVTYTVTTQVFDNAVYTNAAEVIPPAGVTDPDMSNNYSEQSTRYLILLPLILKDASLTPAP